MKIKKKKIQIILKERNKRKVLAMNVPIQTSSLCSGGDKVGRLMNVLSLSFSLSFCLSISRCTEQLGVPPSPTLMPPQLPSHNPLYHSHCHATSDSNIFTLYTSTYIYIPYILCVCVCVYIYIYIYIYIHIHTHIYIKRKNIHSTCGPFLKYN